MLRGAWQVTVHEVPRVGSDLASRLSESTISSNAVHVCFKRGRSWNTKTPKTHQILVILLSWK